MTRSAKTEIGAAVVCALAVGISAAVTHFSGSGMDITAESPAAAVGEADISSSAAEARITAAQNIGITVSFTASPDSEKSSARALVFVSGKPPVTVIVPTEREYPFIGEYTVSGVIADAESYTITLSDCEIIPLSGNDRADTVKPAEATSAAPQSETEKTALSHTEQNEPAAETETVYVSSSGKYHSKPDCSGMKSSTEMSYSEAIAAGHSPCKRCC